MKKMNKWEKTALVLLIIGFFSILFSDLQSNYIGILGIVSAFVGVFCVGYGTALNDMEKNKDE